VTGDELHLIVFISYRFRESFFCNVLKSAKITFFLLKYDS